MSLRRLLTSPATWIASILLVFLFLAWQGDSAAQKEPKTQKKKASAMKRAKAVCDLKLIVDKAKAED